MKKKPGRFLAALLAFVLLCGALPVSAGAEKVVYFEDVPPGIWFVDAVKDLVSRGIMGGKSKNTFAPDDTLTRAEFVTMMARTVLSEADLAQYKYRGKFSDVGLGDWSNPYINWASESKIVNGVGGGRFQPNGQLTRQDMAVMVDKFAAAYGMELPATHSPQLFMDYRSIAKYAVDSVTACQRAGIITGYSDLTFKPFGNAKRCEAAQLYSRFLKLAVSPDYTIIRKRVNGISVDAVELDPNLFNPVVAFGNNRVRGGENVKSIVKRTGAKIAVNAAFFGMNNYAPYGTIVEDGRVLTTFNLYSPAKSAITMDYAGRFSVENYTTKITAYADDLYGTQKEALSIAVNVLPGSTDSTRVAFTKEWGGALGFKAKYAAVVDDSGTVTAVYRDQDVSIPQNGFVLAQRAAKPDDSFWEAAAVGGFLELYTEYVGASTQDIRLSIGVGPKIVAGGQPYGNDGTYKAEGLLNINNFSADERVCIGVKYDGTLVILHAVTSLPELSKIMVAMGCEDAVNLDGGGSANLYVDGQWLTGPRERLLNNMLIFQ